MTCLTLHFNYLRNRVFKQKEIKKLTNINDILKILFNTKMKKLIREFNLEY